MAWNSEVATPSAPMYTYMTSLLLEFYVLVLNMRVQ
jgi:hypothetical protein